MKYDVKKLLIIIAYYIVVLDGIFLYINILLFIEHKASVSPEKIAWL
jgi:hypothetical protein